MGAVTFGLRLLTVGRDDDALQLPELQVLQDFPQAQHKPAFGLGLDGILLVHPVLEAYQFLQQPRDTSIYFFTKHLAAVAERNPRQCRQHQTEAMETPMLNQVHALPDMLVIQTANAALYDKGMPREALPDFSSVSPCSEHRRLDRKASPRSAVEEGI